MTDSKLRSKTFSFTGFGSIVQGRYRFRTFFLQLIKLNDFSTKVEIDRWIFRTSDHKNIPALIEEVVKQNTVNFTKKRFRHDGTGHQEAGDKKEKLSKAENQ